jgi:hypothetical protein
MWTAEAGIGYSVRKVRAGSIEAARRAGTSPARAATKTMIVIAVA